MHLQTILMNHNADIFKDKKSFSIVKIMAARVNTCTNTLHPNIFFDRKFLEDEDRFFNYNPAIHTGYFSCEAMKNLIHHAYPKSGKMHKLHQFKN